MAYFSQQSEALQQLCAGASQIALRHQRNRIRDFSSPRRLRSGMGIEMRYHRSGANYILWALYGLMVCAVLTMQARTFCLLLGFEKVQWYLLVAAGIIFVLFFLLFLPIRLLAGKMGDGRKEGRFGRLLEGLYLILIIAVSLALRLLGMKEAAEGGRGGVLAAVSGFPFASLTFSSLYAWLSLTLSAWMQDGVLAAGFLRPLYETLGILLFYPSLRALAGRIPAVCVTASLSLLPFFSDSYGTGGQEGFFLTASAVLLLLAALYLEKLSDKKKTVWGYAILFGIPAGAAVFLDPIFLTFLIFALWASLFVSGAGSAGRRAGGIVSLLVSALLGFICLSALQLFLSGVNLMEMLAGRFAPFPGLSVHGLFAAASEGWLFWLFPVICFCVFYIFGFFDQRGNVGSVWLPSFLFSSFFSFFVKNAEPESAVTLLCWLIMAGMGIHSACCRERRRPVQEKEGSEAQEAVVPVSSVRPGEPLPNPLPGPKKHAHKQMDYAFEPGEDEMFFDIDQVEEGDDFDL